MLSQVKRLIVSSLVCILSLGTMSSAFAQSDKLDWQVDVDWAANDSGPPDCAWLYVTYAPECLLSGNRSCVISKAILYSHANQSEADAAAWGLVQMTQCHNPPEAAKILQAGPSAVADYLRSF
jgi:hypothetical protein